MKPQALILNNPTQFNATEEQWTDTLTDQLNVCWHHTATIQHINEVTALEHSPQILVTALVPLTAEFLQTLPELKTIIAASTATDYIDLEYCKKQQIKVFNTPKYTGASVAEHAFSLVMACTKHLRHADEILRTFSTEKAHPSMELEGKQLGIIGLGDIGKRVARYAQCFDMDVVYNNRSPKDFPNAQQLPLDELLSTSDIVVMTVPLTSATSNLISQRELALIKSSAFLVNIGADELIHIADLVNALKTQQIAGAALDIITDYERYLVAPNLILTQSRGWYTQESIARRMHSWISTLQAHLSNNDINRVV